MTHFYRNLLLVSLTAFGLAACSEQKKEEKPAPVEIPVTQPEEVQPSETQGLSPKQVDELKVNEDNIANPFPG